MKRFILPLLLTGLFGCGTQSPLSPSTHQPIPRVIKIGTVPTVSASNVYASSTPEPTDVFGFVFADANCAEVLGWYSTTEPDYEDVNGVYHTTADVAGWETCIYTVNTGQWHVGDISGPNQSPIYGPTTIQMWGDSIAFQMLYHNSDGTVAYVNGVGVWTTPTALEGTWSCVGRCGTTRRGATGTWISEE